MNEWLNMPLNEFVKVPWDRLPIGCHIKDGKLLCASFDPSSDLYRAVDFTAQIVRPYVGKEVEAFVIVAAVMFLFAAHYFHEEGL